MRYRPLGGTGIQVSAYCLGTMMFGAIGNTDRTACARIAHTALDAGINLVDTADMYSAGEAEQILGEALGTRRDDVVLATKAHFPMGEDRNRRGNSRRWLTRAVEESLRRLGTDWIDLYQVHRPDPATDIEETLGALTDLVRQGKIRAFGCSSFPAWQVADAHRIAEQRGLHRFRTEQPPYSILARGIERELLPAAHRYGMGVLTWSPLAFGFLTGRRTTTGEQPGARAALTPARFDPALPENAAKFTAAARLADLAEELGRDLPHLAVAFAAAHPDVTSVILGPRTPEQLEHLLAGADLLLDDDTLDRIDAIAPPGIDLFRADSAWQPPELTTPALRRRTPAERVVAA
jgi:aryl-alcohol dehydrogenase-like predicted oxidoreductase